ncbi:RHS repeat-associated core domain-containing protein [Aquimonas voraii]|uniref:RHS repeat-associated core domain-containing protein n=1 Tax=Aquimonas voraii TaxID=265719 RepID=A0A1G6YPA1_9GAMM|nr:RHS repeat-associated core domain-containing protein [Aquimonas voraii]SDD91833.1 RHS repeat-associated core domain-containing protein [Aquimonas voraii]
MLNTRGLPSERSDGLGVTARLLDTLSWDGNGNLTAINDKVGDANAYRNASRSMIYDGLDRLTVANSSPQPPLRTESPWAYSWGEARFSYDGLDNLRTFKMGAADFSYAYASNGQLQSVSQAGVASPIFNYSHNARGQMTGRQFGGQQFTLSWDSAHRVTQTWNAASSVVESYRYDAHGHRVRTVRGGETVYQVYTQGGDLLMERTNTGTTRKYARLGGRLIGETVNGARRAIHTDVIGSVRQKTDAFGTLVHEDVRAPYGSTLIGWQYQNGPAFTGHMEDGATGLTYMKARYYDPVAMRFISPDPVYVNLSTGGNFNRYWYANNNPYTYTDPDGREAGCGTRVQGGATSHCSSTGVPTVSDTNRTNVEKLPRIVDGRASTQVVDLDGEGYESFEAAGLAGYRRFESAYFETSETEEIAGVTIMVNDRHYFTVPVLGGLENRYSLSIENAPDGAVISGRWHTHPFNGANNFSPLDIVGVNREGGVPLLLRAGSGYVGAIYPGQGPGHGFGGVPICDMCLSPHPRYGE